MKLSQDWLNRYISFELPSTEELVELISSRLGAVESVTDLGKNYQGVVIVKVVSCEQHPNADRLHVCQVDDGGKAKDVKRGANGLVQIVCGAPNVKAGMLAAWIPPGVTVPDSLAKEAFVIEAKDIRGQLSQGMLASPKELALNDDHDGILEIEGNPAPGSSFAEVYGLNDTIIELENKMFTHRPDCFGLIGLAREIAGIFNKPFKSPSWYQINPVWPASSSQAIKLAVNNEVPEIVPRFCIVALDNVTVKQSPLALKRRLYSIGLKPINNVVDLTNCYMFLTGQPLHAYDYDKVKALSKTDNPLTLTVRLSKPSDKIKLLNGKVVEPTKNTIMIATETQAIGIGGIMGGADTEVDETTKRVIIECASFDMYSIRRSTMANGLFTEAATRFTKGQSPLQNKAVLNKVVSDVKELAGGKLASSVVDDNHLSKAMLASGSVHPPVTLTSDFINERLGLQLSLKDISKLLKNVEFDVQTIGTDKLVIKAPFWRTDIEIPEDIVEEVGRLHGYDKLPLVLPKRDLTPAPKDPLLTAKALIRQRLAEFGGNEVLSYSFVPASLLDKVGQDNTKALQLANALSPQLEYYRLSLIPSLLEKVHPNIKAGHQEFALFEIGKVHTLERPRGNDGLPVEDELTALVVASGNKSKSSAYYEARKFLEDLTKQALEFKPISAEFQAYQITKPYAPGRSAIVRLKASGEFLGLIGEFKTGVTAQLKLPSYCAGFEVDTTVLQAILSQPKTYEALSKYPKVEQDISLKVPAELPYQTLHDLVWQTIDQLKPKSTIFGLEPLDIYQREEDKTHKQISFRLNISSYEMTLTAEEVNNLLDKVAAVTKTKHGAERL
ncbi:MAG TPA: phenylalanine--tRNA ligase subunit beta [Candidatus Binatia bacterium]|nr:phenylalanine--tRNA ligase subunit beta [Candidatus Binatia bacterium]